VIFDMKVVAAEIAAILERPPVAEMDFAAARRRK